MSTATVDIDIQSAIARKWSLTPLKGKAPIRKGWDSEPTIDRDTLAKHSGNFGLRTGSESKIYVIDVDEYKGGKIPPNLPQTVTVQTGGGGKHFYFAMPDGLKLPGTTGTPGRNRFGDHVDTRGDGGQVVYPGSVHPETGALYEWAPFRSPEEIEPAPLPQWVIEAVLAPVPTVPRISSAARSSAPAGASNTARRRAMSYLAAMPPAISGSGGHARTFEAACVLFRFGLSEDDAMACLLEYNARCQPPWSERELEHKLHDGLVDVIGKGEFASMLKVDRLHDGHEPTGVATAPRTSPAKRTEAKTSATTSQPAAKPTNGSAPPAPAILGNFDIQRYGMDEFRLSVPIAGISERLFRVTDNWPRRVGVLLFAPTRKEIRWMKSTDALFAWIGERGTIRWGTGSDAVKTTLATKGEFVAHLQAVAEAYDGVTMMPHEPQLPRFFCSWEPPDYTPDGGYLNHLLSHFDNAETPQDTALIRAMFVTPAWGGLPGARPAFLVTAPDRGYGKSELTAAVGALYAGILEADLSRKGEGDITTRLLSPEALTLRVVRFDNIRATVASGVIESLITTARISGRQLYTGEGSRPNYLTWLLTANTPQLSRDIADRSFFIRLRKPVFKSGWKEGVFSFIEGHRDLILADVLKVLRGSAVSAPASDRWQSWIDGVLRVCTPDAPAIVALNQQRRNEHDEDLKEAKKIRAALYKLDKTQPEEHRGFVSSTAALQAVNSELNERWSDKKFSNVIKAHIEAGRLLGVRKERFSGARGYELSSNDDGSDTYDG